MYLFIYLYNSNLLDLSTVSHDDLLTNLAISGPKALHGFPSIHAFFHLAKDSSKHSVSVQMKSWFGLGSAFAMYKIKTSVIQDEILFIKFLPIEGLTSSAIMKWSHHLAHKTQNFVSVKKKKILSPQCSRHESFLSLEIRLQMTRRRYSPRARHRCRIRERGRVEHGWMAQAPQEW